MSFNTKVGFVKDKLIESKWTKNLFVHLFPINLSLFTAFLDLERLKKKFLEHRMYVLLIQDIYLMTKIFHVSHRLNLSKQDFIFVYMTIPNFNLFWKSVIVKVVQQQYHLSVGRCCFSRDSWIDNIILNWLCERVLGSQFQFSDSISVFNRNFFFSHGNLLLYSQLLEHPEPSI